MQIPTGFHLLAFILLSTTSIMVSQHIKVDHTNSAELEGHRVGKQPASKVSCVEETVF